MSLLDESLAFSGELGMWPLMERVLARRCVGDTTNSHGLWSVIGSKIRSLICRPGTVEKQIRGGGVIRYPVCLLVGHANLQTTLILP